jgi:hypothetical protein
MIDDWEAMHDLNGADYQAAWNRLRPAGFRPISACVYGPRQAPLYAAIFAKRPARDFVGIHGADTADLQAFFNTNAARGYSPTILSATGPSNNPVFLCVMELSPSGIALTRFGLVKGVIGDQNPNTLEYWLNEADRNNWIPRYVGAYGSPSDVRYTFVADANEERLLWAVAGPEGMSEYQSRFNAETQQYARPVLVTVGPTGYMSILARGQHIMASTALATSPCLTSSWGKVWCPSWCKPVHSMGRTSSLRSLLEQTVQRRGRCASKVRLFRFSPVWTTRLSTICAQPARALPLYP